MSSKPLRILLFVPPLHPIDREHEDGPIVPVLPAWGSWELEEAFGSPEELTLVASARTSRELECELSGLRYPLAISCRLDRSNADRLWARGVRHPGQLMSRLRIAMCASMEGAMQLMHHCETGGPQPHHAHHAYLPPVPVRLPSDAT